MLSRIITQIIILTLSITISNSPLLKEILPQYNIFRKELKIIINLYQPIKLVYQIVKKKFRKIIYYYIGKIKFSQLLKNIVKVI